METLISFFVPGIPATAGSKRGFVMKSPATRSGYRAVLTDDSGEKGRDWRSSVQAAAVQAMAGRDPIPAGVPIALAVEFTLPRPKGHFNAKGEVKPKHADPRKVTKPDLTKHLRAVEDALKGIAWSDDSQVTDQTNKKRWGTRPGAMVSIVGG